MNLKLICMQNTRHTNDEASPTLVSSDWYTFINTFVYLSLHTFFGIGVRGVM
jgi:hypothetical protein